MVVENFCTNIYHFPRYLMDERKYNHIDPFDDGIYETGRTCPPKRHGGLIAFLLILVITLGGITSALGIMNIRMFQQLSENASEDAYTISFSGQTGSSTPSIAETEPETQETQEATTAAYGNETLTIAQTPEALPNVAGESMSWQEIYKKNIPSVVSIICTTSSGSASGTGVVLSEGGYIVTNCHVVADAVNVTVLLSDDRSFPAQVIGSDTVSDLAVLHIDAEDLTAAEFGDSSSVCVGDAVAAIGDPLGVELRGSLTDGIISAINRDVTVEGRTMTLIQTNAALNSGNSGGPLINCYGQVIGINTMKISSFIDSAGVEGLGFAIPSATVKEIVDQLISCGYVSGRPTLGMSCEELSTIYRRYYRLPAGLFINGVDENSPAAAAGIARGDMLLSIDDTEITTVDALNAILYSHDVGDSVTAVIYRNGKRYQVSLTLAEAKG